MRGTLIRPRNGRKRHEAYFAQIGAFAQFGARSSHGRACSVQALAQEAVQTDIGDLDAATAAKLFPDKRPYSPYAGRNFPTRPLFGDTHTHTGFSI